MDPMSHEFDDFRSCWQSNPRAMRSGWAPAARIHHGEHHHSCGSNTSRSGILACVSHRDENHELSDIIGNRDAPYINWLASQNGLATGYTAVTHQPAKQHVDDRGVTRTFQMTAC